MDYRLGRAGPVRQPQPGPAGPGHVPYKPSRTEDYDGVWASAAANMTMYRLLKERAAGFRADPEVQESLAAARVLDLVEQSPRTGRLY